MSRTTQTSYHNKALKKGVYKGSFNGVYRGSFKGYYKGLGSEKGSEVFCAQVAPVGVRHTTRAMDKDNPLKVAALNLVSSRAIHRPLSSSYLGRSL